jgi:hypothetical protein
VPSIVLEKERSLTPFAHPFCDTLLLQVSLSLYHCVSTVATACLQPLLVGGLATSGVAISEGIMKLSVITIAFCIALGACATEAKYQEVLNTWLGQTEAHLASKWGPPDRVYEVEGYRYITSSKGGATFVPGTNPSYQSTVIGNTVYTNPVGGTPPMVISRSCVTTFTVQAGRISSWRYEGNACRA